MVRHMFPAVRDWSEAMMKSLAGGLAMFFAAIPTLLAFADQARNEAPKIVEAGKATGGGASQA